MPHTADPELVTGVVLVGGVQVTVQVSPRFFASFVTVALRDTLAPGAILDIDPLGNEIGLTVGWLDAAQPVSRAHTTPISPIRIPREFGAGLTKLLDPNLVAQFGRPDLRVVLISSL